MNISRTFMLFAVGAVCASVVMPMHLVTAQATYYEGTLESEGWTWDIGLLIERNGNGGSSITVDLPSLWRLGLPVDSYKQTDNKLSFTLPEGLGRVEMHTTPHEIRGTVTMEDGRRGSIRLEPSTKPIVTETEVHLSSRSDGTDIAASVFLPSGSGPFPAAAMIHGGGNSSRDVPGYHFWGTWLARHGIAAVLYDKRGNGKSTSDWRTVDFEARAGDVQAAVDHLRTLPEVDSECVGLIAVSQGSWIANIVAAQDDRLGFVVHVSGPVVPVAQADGYAIENRLRSQGASDEAVAGYLALWYQQVEVLVNPENSELLEQLRGSVAKASEEAWFSTFPYRIGNSQNWFWTWYGLVGDFDPMPYLTETEVPMLWIYGDVDTQSDVARNVAILQQMRDEKGLPSVAVFPQSGHGLMAPSDRFGSPLGQMTVAPGFFQAVFDWIHRAE